MILGWLSVFVVVGLTFGDLFMHNPKGTNDRTQQTNTNR